MALTSGIRETDSRFFELIIKQDALIYRYNPLTNELKSPFSFGKRDGKLENYMNINKHLNKVPTIADLSIVLVIRKVTILLIYYFILESA